MSQDLSRSMQPSPDALMHGYSPTALPQQQQSYGFAHSHRDSPPPLNLRLPTYLRNLASLASPLATPTWLQGGTFKTPVHRQTNARPASVPQHHDQSQPAAPRNTMRVPADSDAALRYGPADPMGSLTIPADTDAVPSNGPSVPNNTLGPRGGIPASGDGEGEAEQTEQQDSEEDRLHVLSGSGVEEEVLEAELQALRAARQQFQRASLSQVHHLHLNPPVHSLVSSRTPASSSSSSSVSSPLSSSSPLVSCSAWDHPMHGQLSPSALSHPYGCPGFPVGSSSTGIPQCKHCSPPTALFCTSPSCTSVCTHSDHEVSYTWETSGLCNVNTALRALTDCIECTERLWLAAHQKNREKGISYLIAALVRIFCISVYLYNVNFYFSSFEWSTSALRAKGRLPALGVFSDNTNDQQ